MPSFYKISVAICSCIAVSVPALAQNIAPLDQPQQSDQTTNDDSICLSLKNALILSARQDPTVAIARAQEREAEAEIKIARSLFRPQVDAFARTGVGSVGLTDSALQNQFGARASQRIFDFGDAKLARRSARFGFRASQFDVQQVQLVAALNTGLAYLEAAQAQEQMKVTEKRRDFFAQQLKSIDILLDQGAATRTERANVASRLADAEAAGLELKFLLDSAQTQVELDTGLLPNICGSEEAVTLLNSLTGKIPNRESAVTIALAKNPNIEAVKNRTRRLEAERKRERASRFPIISVTGISALSSFGRIDQLSPQNRVGLNISVPLYSGNAQDGRNQRATAQQSASQGRVRDIERQLTEEVSIAFQRISSLGQQTVSRSEVEEQSRLRFEAAEIEYNAGTRTLSDFIEVRIEYEQAAIQKLNVEYELRRQQLNFLTLTAQLPIIFSN